MVTAAVRPLMFLRRNVLDQSSPFDTTVPSVGLARVPQDPSMEYRFWDGAVCISEHHMVQPWSQEHGLFRQRGCVQTIERKANCRAAPWL